MSFPKTTALITTKLGTNCPSVKGIHVCSNKGLRPFPWGDNCEIAKYIDAFKNHLLQNHWANYWAGFEPVCLLTGVTCIRLNLNTALQSVHSVKVDVCLLRDQSPKVGKLLPILYYDKQSAISKYLL